MDDVPTSAKPWRHVSALALAMLAGVAAAFAPPAAARSMLAIYHIDVGQGDATLIVGPDDTTLLIDAGNRGKGKAEVVRLLRLLGKATLNYVVASHYDADHIGGLDEVFVMLRDVPVHILDRGSVGPVEPPDTDQYTEYIATGNLVAPGQPDQRQPVKLGMGVINLGPGVSTMVAAANGCVWRRRTTPDPDRLDENGSSVAIVISFGDFDYFVGGDLTGGGRSGSRFTQDLESVVAPIVGDVDVLRLNHHGSQTSNNENFLTGLAPEVTVISVGNGGSNRSRYHHPRRDVLDRLHALADGGPLRRVFSTNQGETDGGLNDADRALMKVAAGDVAIFTDGTHYTVNGETFPTDGRHSGAGQVASGAPPPQQTCEVRGNGNGN